METAETLEQFYERKFRLLPENVRKDIGHFNIFQIAPFREGQVTSVPYRRRDFYKVMLVKGESTVHYADGIYKIKKQALAFSNPLIPYKWEQLDKRYDGVYCIFNAQFFHQNTHYADYEIFQPNGSHVFELTDTQADFVQSKFDQMEKEFGSNYKYKFDLIRNLVMELIHFGMKMEPTHSLPDPSVNAAYRIARLFVELLERQFPLDENHRSIDIKTPSEFAEKLNIHVNSLNRAVKSTMGKTTSQVIADRLNQEAKALLKHTSWSIGDISHSLGFNEVSHFIHFFKKYSTLSPLKFRNAQEVV